MYPNSHWSSYPQYNVVQGALSTSRAAVPTLDQASLTAAAGLSHSLQPHASLPQHVLSSIPAVSLPRDLQSSAAMSQLLGTMTPHVGSFSTQALHKAGVHLAQNQLAYENMATEQQVPATSAHSSVTGFSQDKSTLESKDSPQSYSSPSGSQNLTQESGAKSWMLYDLGSQNSLYLPQLSSSAYAALAGMDLSNTDSLSGESLRLTQPPPAHSSVSRHSAIQRNPFPSDGIMSDTLSQSGKSVVPASLSKPSQAQVSSVYATVDDPRQQNVASRTPSQTPQPQVQPYVIQAQDLKDASRGSQHSQNHYYYVVDTYSSTPSSNTVSIAGSQLGVSSVNYDPVSPATPLAESQTGETAFPSTVSLSDLNAIRSGCPDPHAGYKSSGSNIHNRNASVTQAEPAQVAQVSQPRQSLLINQLSRGREGSKSQMQQISPHQQHSPIGGENTQVSMASLGSPENSLLPSSSVKPVAMPVQAIADSSTGAKPKKPRKPRKPKADVQNASQPPGQTGLANSLQPAFMSSTQGFTRGSSSYQNESGSVQQYQQQQDSQNQMQQQQFVNTSHTSQNLMGVRGGSLNSDANYQVLSSVGNNQVSPISEQSSRSHQQTAETSSLIPLTNTRLPSSPLNGSKNNETAARGGTYQEQQNLLAQNGQYDLQVYSNQPYMEQLVSSQSVRLIPGNLYSESMHVAAGMTVYPYTFQTAEGSTTIDEAAFSNLLMDTGANKTEQQGNTAVERVVPVEPPPQAAAPPATPAVPPPPPSPPAKPAATCTRPVEEDDELCNFAQPPPELSEKDKPVIKGPKCELYQSLQHNASVVPSQKPELKIPPTGPKKTGSGFQDTFMNYLMGQKQETLSSVTTATISERPQLPKYIPEPRRPARPPPTPPPPPAQSSEKAPVPKTPVPNSVSFSDDEDDSKVKVALKKALSTLDSDSNDSEVQEVQGKYCVQSRKDLTMKITLQNAVNKQIKSRGRPPKVKAVPLPVGRGIGEGTKAKTAREPTPPPPRESIGRRAKDAAKEKSKKKRKYHESDSSGVEDLGEEIKPKRHRDGSGSEYDSDKDPVWTPSEEQEAKRPVGFGFDVAAIGDGKTRKKSKSKKSHKKQKHSEEFSSEVASAPAAKTGHVDGGVSHKANSGSRTVHTLSAEDQANNVVDENFQVGQFVLEKKDLHNYEGYPIWRLEAGRMLRKFELYMNNGRVCHKAVSTYSSWMPSMQAAYLPIQVTMVNSKAHAEVVEVLEQYRPTPPNDGSLEDKFENDPLVECFNVYLQTFLSQSLEPSFLEAIRKANETFYLDPMKEIDLKIEGKLEEIDRLVQWKSHFREAMRTRPQMREMDRPNLKQSCQASAHSSPPTIKSVLFYGAAYDRFLLTSLSPSDSASTSQEFLVGKFAAPYVTQYHSLHHFKQNLLKRCKAKVYMVRESQKSTDRDKADVSILDRCLEDRTWVLKIFQDFKELLGELK